MSKLVLHLPNGTVRDIKLDRDHITIGRRADNDICLPYPAVSAEHAVIITVLTDSFLQDLASTNGTLVNGNRINKHFLLDHDAIDIGRVQLVYVMDEAERVAALPPSAPGDEINALTETTSDDDRTTSVDTDPEPATERDHDSSDADLSPVDDLLEDLMDMNSDSSVAVDMPPTISVVPSLRGRSARVKESQRDVNAGVFVEVINGPNAGQIAPMTKREFVFGKAGVTKAVIRREGRDYRLVPIDSDTSTCINGRPIAPDGEKLAFGDTIEVAGVKLRFGHRTPL
ncbi:MAG TPA: FHA domain-containing protein [Actinomycetota bacterium]|nr:FHA domain-containing protein [Actinomycetota bacterium]